jgi:hypothetical protein
MPCQWYVRGGGEGKRRILIGQSVPPTPFGMAFGRLKLPPLIIFPFRTLHSFGLFCSFLPPHLYFFNSCHSVIHFLLTQKVKFFDLFFFYPDPSFSFQLSLSLCFFSLINFSRFFYSVHMVAHNVWLKSSRLYNMLISIFKLAWMITAT